MAGEGLGAVIDGGPGAPHDPARGPWRVLVRGLSQRGGQLTILAGRRTVATVRLAPGEPFTLARDLDPRVLVAGTAAGRGYLRVEIVRPTLRGGVPAEDVALVTSPIYFDLGLPGARWAARPRDGSAAVTAARPGRPQWLALARCRAPRAAPARPSAGAAARRTQAPVQVPSGGAQGQGT